MRTTAEAFADTRHGRLFTNQRRPGCTVCHSSHATEAGHHGHAHRFNFGLRALPSGRRPDHARLAEDMAQILTSLEAAGPGSKDALARARVAVHSLNLDAVKKAAEPVRPSPSPMRNEIASPPAEHSCPQVLNP